MPLCTTAHVAAIPRTKGAITEQVRSPVTDLVLQLERKEPLTPFRRLYKDLLAPAQFRSCLGDDYVSSSLLPNSNVVERAVFRDVRIIRPPKTISCPTATTSEAPEILDVQSGRGRSSTPAQPFSPN